MPTSRKTWVQFIERTKVKTKQKGKRKKHINAYNPTAGEMETGNVLDLTDQAA